MAIAQKAAQQPGVCDQTGRLCAEILAAAGYPEKSTRGKGR